MFRLTKFRHYSSTIGNCFCHNLTNRPLPLSHRLYTVLDKMISIEHDFIPLFSSCRKLTSNIWFRVELCNFRIARLMTLVLNRI